MPGKAAHIIRAAPRHIPACGNPAGDPLGVVGSTPTPVTGRGTHTGRRRTPRREPREGRFSANSQPRQSYINGARRARGAPGPPAEARPARAAGGAEHPPEAGRPPWAPTGLGGGPLFRGGCGGRSGTGSGSRSGTHGLGAPRGLGARAGTGLGRGRGPASTCRAAGGPGAWRPAACGREADNGPRAGPGRAGQRLPRRLAGRRRRRALRAASPQPAPPPPPAADGRAGARAAATAGTRPRRAGPRRLRRRRGRAGARARARARAAAGTVLSGGGPTTSPPHSQKIDPR